ncbi:MAG: MFS transporter [Polyangiaceae bacterium]
MKLSHSGHDARAESIAAATFARGTAESSNWALAVVATLALTVSYVDRQALAAIAPTVKVALNMNHTHFGWLTSAFSMAYLVGAPLSGILLDKYGARKGLTTAVLVWSVVAAMQALAPSFAILFALRIGLGLAESPTFPAAAQTVRRSMPVRARSFAFGMLFTGSSIGAMIAAPLAVTFNRHFGWRAAFVLTSVVGLVWVPLWLFVSRGAKGPEEEKVLPPDSLFHPQPTPTSIRSLFRLSVVFRALFGILCSAPVMLFAINWAPQYLNEARHVPQNDVSHYVWMVPLLFDIGSLGFAFAGSRRDHEAEGSPRKTHWDLLLGAAVLTMAMAFVDRAPGPKSSMFVLGLGTAGCGGFYALLTADLMSRVPKERASTAGGLSAAAQSVTHIVLAPLIGKYIDRTKDFGGMMTMLGMLTLPAVVPYLLAARKERRENLP